MGWTGRGTGDLRVAGYLGPTNKIIPIQQGPNGIGTAPLSTCKSQWTSWQLHFFLKPPPESIYYLIITLLLVLNTLTVIINTQSESEADKCGTAGEYLQTPEESVS